MKEEEEMKRRVGELKWNFIKLHDLNREETSVQGEREGGNVGKESLEASCRTPTLDTNISREEEWQETGLDRQPGRRVWYTFLSLHKPG